MKPPHMRHISEYDKRLVTLLHALAKIWKFWMENTFQEEIDLHVLKSCLGQDQLQGRQKKWGIHTPTCGFGIEHVKEESYDVIGASFQISTMLSLLGSIDPYWESQLLLEYSKNLFTCKVLDGKMMYGRYRVVDEVIYFHDQIYLTKDSKLKDLDVAYEALFSGNVDFIDSYHTIMEGFYWENI